MIANLPLDKSISAHNILIMSSSRSGAVKESVALTIALLRKLGGFDIPSVPKLYLSYLAAGASSLMPSSTSSSSIVKRTYSKNKKPENNLIQELVKRYGEARAHSDGRVPNGFFEAMVNATKKDVQLEDVDLGSMVDLNKKIRRMYGRTAKNENEPSQNKILENEIYNRYERAKIANGGKLPAGMFYKPPTYLK